MSSQNMSDQTNMSPPSFCLPHVPIFVSADNITLAFNDLFDADCVKEVHLKQKQLTKDERTIDYYICFIHFKQEVSVNQDILDKCLADIRDKTHFRIKPDVRKPFFWKVFLNKTIKSALLEH